MGGSGGQRANAMASQGKQHRFNNIEMQRKLKREDLLMKRRGLNFVTEHHEELLSQQTIEACETELDNVAPKIVAILGLSETSDTEQVRNALVKSCLLFQESQKGKREDKKDEEEKGAAEDAEDNDHEEDEELQTAGGLRWMGTRGRGANGQSASSRACPYRPPVSPPCHSPIT